MGRGGGGGAKGKSMKSSAAPSFFCSDAPSVAPSAAPSDSPVPSLSPSDQPSLSPSDRPSLSPSDVPSMSPSDVPSQVPSQVPSEVPSDVPSAVPSDMPSLSPSSQPSDVPSVMPSTSPSDIPSLSPSASPSSLPSMNPSDTSCPATTVTLPGTDGVGFFTSVSFPSTTAGTICGGGVGGFTLTNVVQPGFSDTGSVTPSICYTVVITNIGCSASMYARHSSGGGIFAGISGIATGNSGTYEFSTASSSADLSIAMGNSATSCEASYSIEGPDGSCIV